MTRRTPTVPGRAEINAHLYVHGEMETFCSGRKILLGTRALGSNSSWTVFDPFGTAAVSVAAIIIIIIIMTRGA